MARPLVLKKTDHPTIWTPVYADVEDPKMTDWLWEQDQCRKQKLEFLRKKNNKTANIFMERNFGRKQGKQRYKLMTSVSTPVYDTRTIAVSFTLSAS